MDVKVLIYMIYFECTSLPPFLFFLLAVVEISFEFTLQTSEDFKKKPLSCVNEKVLRVGDVLSNLSEQRVNCLDAVLRCKRLIDWLKKTIPGGMLCSSKCK